MLPLETQLSSVATICPLRLKIQQYGLHYINVYYLTFLRYFLILNFFFQVVPPCTTQPKAEIHDVGSNGANPNSLIHPLLLNSKRNPGTLEKTPVGLLNELKPGLEFRCISEKGEQYNKFVMEVYVDNERFEGSGKFYFSRVR